MSNQLNKKFSSTDLFEIIFGRYYFLNKEICMEYGWSREIYHIPVDKNILQMLMYDISDKYSDIFPYIDREKDGQYHSVTILMQNLEVCKRVNRYENSLKDAYNVNGILFEDINEICNRIIKETNHHPVDIFYAIDVFFYKKSDLDFFSSNYVYR